MIDRILDDATALTHAQAGEWSDCAARLNAIATPTPVTTLRGSGWLMTAMPADAEAILEGFAQAQVASAVEGSPLAAYRRQIERTNNLLDTSGIDWSTVTLQGLLPVVALVASWSPELLAKVQAIGLPKPAVTAGEVEAEWAQHLLDSALAAVVSRVNSVRAAATAAYDAPGASAASIATAAQAAWEA